MSVSDLSYDIWDKIFLEVYPGTANGKIKDVLNVYKVPPSEYDLIRNAKGLLTLPFNGYGIHHTQYF